MLSKKILDDNFDERSAHRLYTCFDQKNTNRFPWVVIVASVRVLLKPTESTIAKLLGVFEVFEQYARGKITLGNCQAVFVLANGSDQELHEMKMHYRHSFRAYLQDALLKENKKENKNATIDLSGGSAVEFAKVTRDVFEDALRKCPKIVQVFGEHVSSAVESSGAAEGEGGL